MITKRKIVFYLMLRLPVFYRIMTNYEIIGPSLTSNFQYVTIFMIVFVVLERRKGDTNEKNYVICAYLRTALHNDLLCQCQNVS